MKKKILAAILTAAMTIGMVGCGSTRSIFKRTDRMVLGCNL